MDEISFTPAILEQLSRLQSGKRVVGAAPYEKCLCKKLLPTDQYLRKCYSGVVVDGKVATKGINYEELLCEDCRKDYREMARLVCLKCRRLMGFYKPGKQWSGFAFQRGAHYHLYQCPRCTPENPCTPVLEHESFCKIRGIRTDIDRDLLKEIEQKILQAQKDADRIRTQLNPKANESKSP